MNKAKILLLCLIFIIGWESCNDSQNFPDEPAITYVGMNKFNLTQGQTVDDSLIFFLTFTDGDGDLGFLNPNNPGTPDIEITDSRQPNFPSSALLAFVPEMGSGGGISGDLAILQVFKPFEICCFLPNGRICETLDGFPEDVYHYTIRIKDRAGNWSNTIQTDDVTVACD